MLSRSFAFALTAVVGVLAASPAAALQEFSDDNEVPNATVIPAGAQANCQICHRGRFGAAPWNSFGDSLFVAKGVGIGDQGAYTGTPSESWAAVCELDADGDGQTNGEELGDPECVWTFGATPGRTTDISNPGDAASLAANPTAVDGAEGEGEGEGEGETPAGGCFGNQVDGSGGAPISALVLLGAVLALARRRR